MFPKTLKSLNTGFGLVGLAGLAVGGLGAQARRDPLAGLDLYIDRARREWAAPGVAVAVVKDDSVVYAKGFGVRVVGQKDPVDEHTIFAIASVSKTFTATAAAILVDAGTLRWDDRVIRWLPWFQLYDPYVTQEITLRDLLSHRSGLGQRGDMLWYMSSYDRNELVRRIRFLEPNANFRSAVGYQNILFTAAGQMVATAGGMSWDEFIRRRIFEALGMTASSTSIRNLVGQPNVATPHNIVNGQARPVPWHNVDNIGPAGSINSSVRDLAQYLRFHLAAGMYRGERLVSSAALNETKRPQIYIGGGEGFTGFVAEGLGWVIEEYRGRRVVRHDGGIDGMLSELWTVPEDRLGLAILTNAEPHLLAVAIRLRILDTFVGGPLTDWSAELLKQARESRTAEEAAERNLQASRVKGAPPSLPLDRYVGTYHDPMYGDLIIVVEDGHLVARYQSFSSLLEHWHYDTFRAAWAPGYLAGKAFFTFALDAMATVARLEVENLAVFPRVAPPTPPR